MRNMLQLLQGVAKPRLTDPGTTPCYRTHSIGRTALLKQSGKSVQPTSSSLIEEASNGAQIFTCAVCCQEAPSATACRLGTWREALTSSVGR